MVYVTLISSEAMTFSMTKRLRIRSVSKVLKSSGCVAVWTAKFTVVAKTSVNMLIVCFLS